MWTENPVIKICPQKDTLFGYTRSPRNPMVDIQKYSSHLIGYLQDSALTIQESIEQFAFIKDSLGKKNGYKMHDLGLIFVFMALFVLLCYYAKKKISQRVPQEYLLRFRKLEHWLVSLIRSLIYVLCGFLLVVSSIILLNNVRQYDDVIQKSHDEQETALEQIALSDLQCKAEVDCVLEHVVTGKMSPIPDALSKTIEDIHGNWTKTIHIDELEKVNMNELEVYIRRQLNMVKDLLKSANELKKDPSIGMDEEDKEKMTVTIHALKAIREQLNDIQGNWHLFQDEILNIKQELRVRKDDVAENMFGVLRALEGRIQKMEIGLIQVIDRITEKVKFWSQWAREMIHTARHYSSGSDKYLQHGTIYRIIFHVMLLPIPLVMYFIFSGILQALKEICGSYKSQDATIDRRFTRTSIIVVGLIFAYGIVISHMYISSIPLTRTCANVGGLRRHSFYDIVFKKQTGYDEMYPFEAYRGAVTLLPMSTKLFYEQSYLQNITNLGKFFQDLKPAMPVVEAHSARPVSLKIKAAMTELNTHIGSLLHDIGRQGSGGLIGGVNSNSVKAINLSKGISAYITNLNGTSKVTELVGLTMLTDLEATDYNNKVNEMVEQARIVAIQQMESATRDIETKVDYMIPGSIISGIFRRADGLLCDKVRDPFNTIIVSATLILLVMVALLGSLVVSARHEVLDENDGAKYFLESSQSDEALIVDIEREREQMEKNFLQAALILGLDVETDEKKI